MILRLLAALFDDLTRLAYIGVFLILGVFLTAFTGGMLAHLLWNMATLGWYII